MWKFSYLKDSTEQHSLRVDTWDRCILHLDTPYLLRCGVLCRLFQIGSFHNLHEDKRKSAPHFLCIYPHFSLGAGDRGEIMKDHHVYFRPEWTCGKYNEQKRVAIMFNLIANGEYFFEEESADVVGLILKAGRNGEISIPQISSELKISPTSISAFFESLISVGLLTDKKSDEEDILNYRKLCAEYRTDGATYIGENIETYLQCKISSVEQAYARAVADCTGITSAVFELTYRCSENCLHCYNIGATRNDTEINGRGALAELSIDEYRSIIDDMCDSGLVTATITGGDPFVNKHVWDILEYLFEKDIAVNILTNGQQLKGNINRLASLYPKNVRLSLYSADSEIHDKITRKKGSWQTTMNILSELNALSVPIAINCILMRPGIKSYFRMKDIGKQLCCPVLFDFAVVDSLEGDISATKNLRLTPEELELVMMDPDIETDPSNMDAYANPAPAEGLPCLAGSGIFCVMPNGTLIPCVSLHLTLGDLKVHSFKSIIRDNKVIASLHNTPESEYLECGSHEYCKYCVFCAGNSHSEHGNPFRSNSNCCYIAKCRHSLHTKIKSGRDVLNGKSVQECIDELPVFNIPTMCREYKTGKRGPENPL